MKAISSLRAEELCKIKLPQLRSTVVPVPSKHLVIVDEYWELRSIDVHVGDLILFPLKWRHDGAFLSCEDSPEPNLWKQGQLVIARKQGQSFIQRDQQPSLKVRVSRQGYVGRNRFRHLDDPDDGA